MISNRWVQDLSKVDFATSAGLYVLPDQLVLVRLRKSFRQVALLKQESRGLPESDAKQGISELTGWIPEDVREIALKGENESRERALRQALLSLMPHINAAKDSVFICVPQDQAIVQQIFLPQAAEANLREVVEYEIERHIPFRRSDIYYDYLPLGKRGDKLALFLCAIPKKSLSTLLAVLESFGVKPRGIETTATALANYFLFCAGEGGETATIIGAQNHALEVVGVKSNVNGWRQVPALTFAHWVQNMNGSSGSAKDLLEQCLTPQSKLYAWGDVQNLVQGINGTALQCEDLVARGRQKLNAPITGASVLPAIGAALRGVREASIDGNVLGAALGHKRHGVMTYVNAALATLLIIAAMGWALVYPIKDELRLRQLEKENQKLQPAVDALRSQEEQLRRIRTEQTFFTQLDQRKGEVLRVLDELSKIVPTNAYFTNLRYHNGNLELQGSAENASGLIPLLERSPVFENVGFNAPSNRGRDNRETFSLKADLEKPKEKVEQPVKR